MIDDLVGVLSRLTLIGFQLMTVERRASLNVLLDLFLECLLLATIDNDGADLAATFRDAHDSGLVFSALSQLSAVAFEQGACSVLSRRSSFRLLQLPRSASRKFQIASLCESGAASTTPATA